MPKDRTTQTRPQGGRATAGCGCIYEDDKGHDTLAGFEVKGLAGFLELLALGIEYDEWQNEAPARRGERPAILAPQDWPDFVARHGWTDRALVADAVDAIGHRIRERARTRTIESAWMLVTGALASIAPVSEPVMGNVQYLLGKFAEAPSGRGGE